LDLFNGSVRDSRLCALVLHVVAANRTERVIDVAGEHKVGLPFVPACTTGEIQPLDRSIFGEFKSRTRLKRQTQMTQRKCCNVGSKESLMIRVQGPDLGTKWPSELLLGRPSGR
jgi:hypothetical protein